MVKQTISRQYHGRELVPVHFFMRSHHTCKHGRSDVTYVGTLIVWNATQRCRHRRWYRALAGIRAVPLSSAVWACSKLGTGSPAMEQIPKRVSRLLCPHAGSGTELCHLKCMCIRRP